MARIGRAGHRWRQVQAHVFATETECWICGQWVNPALPWNHPQARSVDHIVALSEGGDPYDRRNLHLAHRQCNWARGTGQVQPATPDRTPSRQWR